MPRNHKLKIWPEPFKAVASGRKRHEIRIDDRGFMVGDVLILREWEPHGTVSRLEGYTGEVVPVIVTYITPGGAWGLPANLCVMSIDVIPPVEEVPDAELA